MVAWRTSAGGAPAQRVCGLLLLFCVWLQYWEDRSVFLGIFGLQSVHSASMEHLSEQGVRRINRKGGLTEAI